LNTEILEYWKIEYGEHLKTSVFRCFPLKNVCFATRRVRNYKGAGKNNQFLEAPYGRSDES
jgi:hypothetical protein